MADKRKYVIPGDVITSGPFRPEQNVVLEGNNIVATSVGISEIYKDSVKVIPLTGKYIPKINDLVIGKVISHTSLSWELDVNSCYVGFLPAQDVFGRDNQLKKINIDETFLSLNGYDSWDFSNIGGLVNPNTGGNANGDVNIIIPAHTAGDTFSIVFEFLKYYEA